LERAFEGNGRLTEFGGGFDDWQRFQASRNAETVVAKTPPKPADKAASMAKTRLSFKESKELEALPAKIETLQARINTLLADGAIFRNDPAAAKTAQLRLADLALEIERALARWEELEQI
jgi:ATP-binding cassette subfamily F protein uup